MATIITWTLKDGQSQAIELDAVVRQSHESSATATEHPVETGANISDHIRPNLDRLTLEVVVSNKPTTVPATQMDGVSRDPAGLELQDQTGLVLAKANVLIFDGEFDRVRTIYDLLLELQSNGEIVSIQTSLRDYTNMVLQRVSPLREAGSGDALFATVEARQIRVVDSEVVEVQEPEQDRDRRRRNRGRQNTAESTNPRDSSVLARLMSTFFGL
jgi:hypothetical protein